MHRFAALPVLALIVAGCDDPSVPPTAPEAVATYRLDPVGEPIQVAGFSTPESMVYDPVADVYLVSNVNGHPQALTNDGFISRVRPDGTIEELEWIRGGVDDVVLHGPTGMVLVEDVLYVADMDAVRLFDRESGAPLGEWAVSVSTEPIPGLSGPEWVRGVLLNGVCAGPRGEIYVTATGIDIDLAFDLAPTGEDAVYRFDDGIATLIAEGPELAGPNGCVVKGANLYIATLLSDRIYRLNPSGRIFHVATLPQGGLDGLIEADGSLFVSSVFGGSIYRLSAGGSRVTEVASGIVSPADLGYDTLRSRLLVPSLFGDFVLIQDLR